MKCDDGLGRAGRSRRTERRLRSLRRRRTAAIRSCHPNNQSKKNKCGPGQPPGPHCFSRNPVYPFSTHEAWGRAAFHQHSEESGRPCYSADCHSRSKLHESTCSTTVVPAASPAVCGGLLRRPQRPGNQCAPRRVSGGTLPTIHPRELSGTAGSAAMLWQGMQESRLNVDTVRYRSLTIKRKPEARCAETVNVRSSLWKVTENQH